MMFPHNFIGSFLKMAGSFKHLHSQDLSGLFFQLPITTGCVDDSWKRKSKRCDALASYFKYAFGKSASQPVQFCHLYRKLNDINQMNSTRKSFIKFPLGLAKVSHLTLVTWLKKTRLRRPTATNKRANSHNFKAYIWIYSQLLSLQFTEVFFVH